MLLKPALFFGRGMFLNRSETAEGWGVVNTLIFFGIKSPKYFKLPGKSKPFTNTVTYAVVPPHQCL